MALTQADTQLIEDFANSKSAVQEQARARWTSSEPYQSNLVSKYRDMHHYYNPINGDHWPEDVALRPGKLHTTTNLCKSAVDVSSRLLSLPPRITMPVTNLGGDEVKRAEAAESLMLEWLELSGFEDWFYRYAQTGGIYGKAVLKPYWNDTLKRPDVTIIENPANLRLGWGSSDYSVIDWAMYEYSLSAQEAQFRFDVTVEMTGNRNDPPHIRANGGDHSDPLNQKDDAFWKPFFREHSEYERTQIKVWDYWYKKRDGTVCNVVLLNGVIADGPHEHSYLADIPYIVTEYDHEPGSPEGIALIEPIRDLQDEFNRLLSHGLQHIADDVDPAWYIAGPGADMAPAGIVPKAGEVVGVGETVPGAWPKSVNTFPISEMMNELWNEFHRLTGLPEILFGQTPGADTSGRAIAIQVEAAANRLEPRRRRLYQGLKDLLVFWTIMAERKNPKIAVAGDEEGTTKDYAVGDLVKGFRRWKIIAPEITPRDNIELGQHAANMVNAKLWSRRDAMNQIGVEAPEYEMQTIREESSDIKISPAEVQAQLSVYTIAAQLEATQMQNQQLRQQLQGLQQPAAAPQSILEQANGSQAQLQNAQQAAAPTGFEDQNNPEGAGLPATPPGGGPAPGGNPAALTALSRQGEALNQIAFNEDFNG